MTDKFTWEDGDLILGPVEKFDPAQPRDEIGQFAETGAGRFGAARMGLKPVSSRAEWPEHIIALAVPPGWTNVHIANDPNADLLVVGKDSKGRDVYIYSERFKSDRAEAKFERVRALNEQYDAIKLENQRNLGSTDPKVADHAATAALVMETGLRPGSEEDTGGDVQAYGATTLESQHVYVSPTGDVSLRFVGKKGVALDIPLRGASADIVRDRSFDLQEGDQLFPNVSQRSLNEYMGTLGNNAGFRTKDFRTVLGTRTAIDAMRVLPLPTSGRAYRSAVNTIARSVATQLGNTPVVALQSYIDPSVFSSWRQSSGV